MLKSNKNIRAVTAENSPVRETLKPMRKVWVGVGILSLFVNLLMLTGPLYMLQVYDRVITSQSMSTLVALSILMVVMYAFMGFLDFLRSRLLVRIGNYVEKKLAPRTFQSWLKSGQKSPSNVGHQPLQSLATIKRFLTGSAPTTFFDIPWTPVYIAVIFMIDWTLGVVAIIGAILVLIIAIGAELSTRKRESVAHQARAMGTHFSQTVKMNSEAVVSMGMVDEMTSRWNTLKVEGEDSELKASDISGGATAMSKAFRMFLQSAILGFGAALAVQQIISPGAMIAGSIILGRALAPIQMIIGQWRNYIQTKNAYAQLNEFYDSLPADGTKVSLPAPTGKINIENLVAGPPGAKNATLKGLNFELVPGDGLCVIGHSGSGKSSLARLLVGVWLPQRGSVRLDGATLDQWDTDQLGKHIGYLPQTVALFDGTVGENIARFRKNQPPEAIIRAAQIAGIHEFVLSLPDGYNTQLGLDGTVLSVGQIQRIALARALYGDPCLVVLDEPNSNLDAQGDQALNAAINYMRAQKKTVVIISHRPIATAAVNKMLVLRDGKQEKFGHKEQGAKAQNKAKADQAVSNLQRAHQQAQRQAQQQAQRRVVSGQKV